MRVKRQLWKRMLLIGLIAILAILPHYSSTYVITFLFLLFIYIALAESYDFIGGYTGYINLGHVAFFGIGAYVFSLLFKSGLFLPVAIVVGGAVATIFAAAISYPFFRLRGAYYCIATIGLVFFLYYLSFNLEITGGVKGISIPVPIEITLIPCYYSALSLALVTILISYKFENSKFGLALISIREDEDTAEIFGINTFKYKAIVLMLCAFPAGMAGGVYAWFLGYINPETVFGLTIALSPIIMAFLGGSGNFLGPVVGAFLLRLIQEIIWIKVPYFHLATYGIALIIVGLFMPRGIIRSERLISLANKIYRLKG